MGPAESRPPAWRRAGTVVVASLHEGTAQVGLALDDYLLAPADAEEMA
jgi:hypothetical protein